MSTLKIKAQQILDEKQASIKPENIKKDITAFNVQGTYDGFDDNGNIIIQITKTTTSSSSMIYYRIINRQFQLADATGSKSINFIENDKNVRVVVTNIMCTVLCRSTTNSTTGEVNITYTLGTAFMFELGGSVAHKVNFKFVNKNNDVILSKDNQNIPAYTSNTMRTAVVWLSHPFTSEEEAFNFMENIYDWELEILS